MSENKDYIPSEVETIHIYSEAIPPKTNKYLKITIIGVVIVVALVVTLLVIKNKKRNAQK